jgi:hypothetical protein
MAALVLKNGLEYIEHIDSFTANDGYTVEVAKFGYGILCTKILYGIRGEWYTGLPNFIHTIYMD